MSVSIDGVPEKISRADYVRLIESVGLDPNMLVSLEFRSEGIYATVAATSGDGKRIVTRSEDGEYDFATHSVWIQIDDEVAA